MKHAHITETSLPNKFIHREIYITINQEKMRKHFYKSLRQQIKCFPCCLNVLIRAQSSLCEGHCAMCHPWWAGMQGSVELNQSQKPVVCEASSIFCPRKDLSVVLCCIWNGKKVLLLGQCQTFKWQQSFASSLLHDVYIRTIYMCQKWWEDWLDQWRFLLKIKKWDVIYDGWSQLTGHYLKVSPVS